ncbi:hypothetical protein HBH56_108460 [Parastagonospora nodorum]|uniref:Histone chaperone domain-containing protein n=2 Tax=Phaeosphaeria nodorum (strain SN15 / ATCC MYA-4574 / FGSC 10173) TaxID=321614 RepID=A0A7U2FDD1_PHANO|nr:hypothetical protein SNOG_09971 [Parastagonospora nodorum SN15]KAH3912857.1 hypothetical protein HBH56_108460 [Parastagonospora nodorum]EAT82306.1 hypothetical protein SNOG_09971 [Parastagonospora nodorum SN15]KAH3922232.1 hypothetical protein HBH54_225560 [Parastagonospora nodorum]KAH3974506.1 hypothetical protein HBH51_094040 [Parastagonospora nodorum]KAH3979221.1 hypothetical protein HBH52_102010 [Parastagonospora nodorum]
MSGTKDSLAHRRKRVRFEADASSDPSISEESALASTSVADDSTVTSDFGSDSDSELSESSEEPSSDSSSEDEDDEDAASDAELHEHKGNNGVVNLRAGQGKKPTMKLNKEELGPDIRDFLKDFLPQLKAANDELEAQRKAGTLKSREIDMTDAEEADQYIEMDLGLGVLEEKGPNADDDSASDSDEEMGDDVTEKDVLGKLMGRPGTKEGVVIQEVQDAQKS